MSVTVTWKPILQNSESLQAPIQEVVICRFPKKRTFKRGIVFAIYTCFLLLRCRQILLSSELQAWAAPGGGSLPNEQQQRGVRVSRNSLHWVNFTKAPTRQSGTQIASHISTKVHV
ncbi:hypothetical protein TGVEG_214295, partial [Toxoplasma gondii VEG]